MLTGEHLRLAPLRDEDLEVLFGWINDREQVLLNSPYRPVHAWDHRAWFESVPSRDDVAIFGIRLDPDDVLIGSCQLNEIDPYRGTAYLQIRIGQPSARGRGLGTEAVCLLLGHAFDDLRLRRVTLSVFADNAAAIRCYEKAGFRREGLLREAAYLDGRTTDVLVMGILRAEYLAQPEPRS